MNTHTSPPRLILWHRQIRVPSKKIGRAFTPGYLLVELSCGHLVRAEPLGNTARRIETDCPWCKEPPPKASP